MPDSENGESTRPGLLIEGEATFRLFSPWPELMSAVSEGLLAAGNLRLAATDFLIKSAIVIPQPAFQETMLWQPVREASVVTSWKNRETGAKLYALPGKPADGRDCADLLRENLLHKWLRFTDETGRPDIAARWAGLNGATPAETKAWATQQNVQVELADQAKARTRLFHIKNIPVRSWVAPVKVTAPIGLQRLIWSAGLGEMNSMGFGAVEVG